MKHALETFVGQHKQTGELHFDTTCGLRIRFPKGAEISEDEPIDDRKGGKWCPTCYPDKCVARLRDEDGADASLHPDLGELEQEGDGTVMAEDRGEEEVLAEEVDER